MTLQYSWKNYDIFQLIKWKKDKGEKRERERESCIRIYFIILVGNIYYSNEQNRKIKIEMLNIL